MPATFSTVSRRLLRMSRSVLKPHLSLNRKPKAACEEIEDTQTERRGGGEEIRFCEYNLCREVGHLLCWGINR